MATDLETLVVQMSADFKSYENAFAKATGVTKQQLAVIKGEAANTGKVAAVALDGATRGVQRFGQQAQTSVRGVQNLRLQTGNLAAQFQDIAVQLQSGTPLYTIALQQGTQISAVLGGGGAAGAVKALGAAFASVISPLSLVTMGLIVAGGAAVQYFASLFDGGEKSEEELKKQGDLIQKVAKEWGDAVPALREYADELERIASEADRTSAAEMQRSQIVQGLKTEFEAMGKSMFDALETINSGDMTLIPQIFQLQEAFAELETKVIDGKASTEDFEKAQDALASLIESTGNPALIAFAGNLNAVAGSASVATGDIARLTSQINRAASAMQTFRAAETESNKALKSATITGDTIIANKKAENALTSEELDLKKEIKSITSDIEGEGGVADPKEVLQLAKETLAAEEARAAAAKAARSSGGGSDKAAKDAEREREAVTKLIEQLQFESTLIGKTALEKEKMNALRRAGAAATPEETAEIQRLVEANYAEIEALQKTEDQMNRLKDVSRDVLGGIFEDLRDGVEAADLLANALNRVVEAMTQTALDKVIEGAFAGGFQNPFARGAALPPATYVPGRLYHGGGIAGLGPTHPMPAAWFANAPRFHNGGEVPALLLPGERVLSRRESAGYGGGDVTVQVFNAPAGTQVQESKGPDGKRLIKVMLKPALQELMSDGSMDGTLRSNFGVRRRPR